MRRKSSQEANSPPEPTTKRGDGRGSPPRSLSVSSVGWRLASKSMNGRLKGGKG